MAWKPITREIYDAMLAAFRDKPGNYSHAALRAGVERRMAKHGWEVGWQTPKGGATWARPFREILKEEQDAARALLMRKQEDERQHQQTERDLVRQEAVERRSEMLQIVKATRGAVKLSVGIGQRILNTVIRVLESLPSDIQKLSEMHPAQKVKLGREAIEVASKIMAAVRDLDTMARLEENKPTEIIQVEEMTMDQAVIEIESAKALIDLARREGLIEDPGSGEDPGGNVVQLRPDDRPMH